MTLKKKIIHKTLSHQFKEPKGVIFTLFQQLFCNLSRWIPSCVMLLSFLCTTRGFHCSSICSNPDGKYIKHKNNKTANILTDF